MTLVRHRKCLVAVALFSLQTVHAQTTPDAGSLLQQIEKGRPPPPRTNAPAVGVPPPMRALSGSTVTVTAFRFVGNTLLSNEQLGAALAGLRGRPLDFTQLQQAPATVAALYRQSGWIVRAYLPHQEIVDGVVTIQIVEAIFGEVRLDGGAAAARIAPQRLIAMVDAAQSKGALLNADALDRALLLLGDLPGVTVTGSLSAGRNERETDLLLKVEDAPLLSGVVSVDNAGSRSTGRARVSGDIYLNSPFRLGDQIGLSLQHSEGIDYARLDASVPVGSSGVRAGAHVSALRYKLVSDDTAALDARGKSSTSGLDGSYPLIRSRLKNLSLAVNYDHRRFDNDALGASVSDYRIDTLSASLYGNALDQLGGGGNNTGSLSLVRGEVDLDDSPTRAADAATVKSAGRFTKLRYAAARTQALNDALLLYMTLAGQAARKNLDSAEKFYLGGPSGVRAYPINEGGGASGQLASIELRAQLPHNLSLAGFYDWGHVRINHDNHFAGAETRNAYSLRGAGVALSWLAPKGISIKSTWARRIGANPNPSASGSDQDGSLTRNRFWLQASLPF
ncbi:ShlB/FhaC/HecB family hemolysin secretion/activation protein [Massilia rubra]|uniref:ShlB/FhaC/HecB family hemolysin secretion/activation protein n=1 Tax=Massilia rubra TaxID=2607910 RepID=A0ABX0LF23_9BURK|nr:ShlB/FhaC/HecB family hemolysin secretion/activation protein [Massilia rubra]NHZ33416.1 ShlB/FhaC/HecB family hemolysin secretion/activation protein [Massilia rubra]